MKKLTDICNPKQWKTIPLNELTPKGYPVYGANGIIGFYSQYNHENETILITCRGATCGSINICQPFSYVTGNAMCLDNLNSNYDMKFLYHYLSWYNFSGIITGTAQPQITLQGLSRVAITQINFDAQIKIAILLETIDSLIDQRKEQLATLDTLVKSRFVEMFGDLYHNPMNWPVKNFTELATIESNMIHDFTGYEDFPHIGIDSIEKNTGALVGYRTVREDGIISGKYLFTPKHIIYSKIRPNLNKVALPDFEGVCSADSYAILPKENVCNRIFLAHVMRSPMFLDYILPFSNRTNLPKVNRKQVEGFNLPTPPIALQNQFADFVQLTDKSKIDVQQSIDTLSTLKRKLMQDYFG